MNGATLEQYQSQLQQWRSVLGDKADLLIYSCFTALGMDGEAFIKQLADLTGTDVAASLDVTGSENFGGDWNLEYSTGEIEANNPFNAATLATWEGKLAVITVTSAADNLTGGDGLITLREALQAANNNTTVDGVTGSGADEIIFDTSGVFSTLQTITTNTSLGEFVISDDLKITGTGQGSLFLDGGGTNRVVRIESTIPGTNVTIENITIRNGFLNNDNGAGIYVNGSSGVASLTLRNSTVSGNTIEVNISSSSGGAGISISGNNLSPSTLTLEKSTVSNNRININPSSSTGFYFAYGAGIGVNDNYSSLTLKDSTISSNTIEISPGFWGSSSASGSGLFIGGNVTSSLTSTLTNSTISGNQANINNGNGGGIFNQGKLDIINTTISGNTASQYGGGIHNTGEMTITHATIADNSSTDSGGGIFFNFASSGGESLTIQNSMIANNTSSTTSGDDIFDSVGSINFNGINLVKDGSKSGVNIINADPNLAPLGNYGGVTQTHFLLPFSVALDAGDNAFAANPNDQRGGSRIANGTVDLGAVEFQGTNLSIISGDGQKTFVSNPFEPLVFEAKENTFNNPLAGLTITLYGSSSSSSSSGTDPGFSESFFQGITDSSGQVRFLTRANDIAGEFSFFATTSAGGSDFTSASGNLTNVEAGPDGGDCATSCTPQTPQPTIVTEPLEIAVEQVKDTLKRIEKETNTKSALIYLVFRPASPSPIATTEIKDNIKDGTKDIDVKNEDQENQTEGNYGETQWEFRSDRLTEFLNAATENFLHPRDNLNWRVMN